jgi:Flp pilus assembly pilin Flp
MQKDLLESPMKIRELSARLASDRRGGISSEYVVLTGLVAIATIPAFLYVGAAVAKSFIFVRSYLLVPFP